MTADILTALRQGEFTTALESARALSESRPADAGAWHLLGIARLRVGDRDGARAALDRALVLMPDRVMFHITRAVIGLSPVLLSGIAPLAPDAELSAAQLPAAAAELLLLLAQGRNTEAGARLARLQAVDAELPVVKLAEGHVLQLRGQAGRALRCFRAAAEGEADSALAQVSLGLAYLQHGQYPLAEQALRAADAIEPDNAGVSRALIEVCRRLGKQQETIALLDRVLATEDDAALRTLRAQLHIAAGNSEAARTDLLQVLDAHPGHEGVLLLAVDVLQHLGRDPEAVERVERALAAAGSDIVWELRLRLAADDTGRRELLSRWSAALPASARCLSQRARWHERAGELDQARQLAEETLALTPGLLDAELLLLRADVASDPEAALRRIEGIRAGDDDANARRRLLAFRGLARDRLGKHADALADWSRMAQIIAAEHPLPMPEPAQQVPAGQVDGWLLWAPPGVAIEPILAALDKAAPGRLWAERAHAPKRRDDGFGVRRFQPGHEKAGSAQRWQSALQVLGHDPAQAIDWLPHFDAYTAAALQGARTLACLVDPRDALLNWMVFGSTAGYVFLPDAKQDADWLARSLEALADHREAHPDAVTILPLDAVVEHAAQIAAQLHATLALAATPDAALLARAPGPSPALPMRFPAGHWRRYRDALAEPFARLTPVAQRLGYPAE